MMPSPFASPALQAENRVVPRAMFTMVMRLSTVTVPSLLQSPTRTHGVGVRVAVRVGVGVGVRVGVRVVVNVRVAVGVQVPCAVPQKPIAVGV